MKFVVYSYTLGEDNAIVDILAKCGATKLNTPVDVQASLATNAFGTLFY